MHSWVIDEFVMGNVNSITIIKFSINCIHNVDLNLIGQLGTLQYDIRAICYNTMVVWDRNQITHEEIVVVYELFDKRVQSRFEEKCSYKPHV